MKLEASLVISNLNLPPTAAIGGTDVHRDFLRHVSEDLPDGKGYDGYEFTPTRRLCRDIERQAARGTFLNEVDGQRLIASGHESWGQGFEGFKRSVTGYKPLGETAMMAAYGSVLVEQEDSLGRIAHLGKLMPRTVVFGDSRDANGHLLDYQKYGLQGTSVQPSPELFETWGVHFSPKYGEVKDHMSKQGIGALTIDTFHIARNPKKEGRLIAWSTFLDVALSHEIPISQMHLDGRNDMGTKRDRELSMQNLRAMLRAKGDIGETRSGEILAQACAVWKKQQEMRGQAPGSVATLPVVIEAPYSAVRQAWSEERGHKMRYKDFVHAHQLIIQNVGAYVADCLKVQKPNI